MASTAAAPRVRPGRRGAYRAYLLLLCAGVLGLMIWRAPRLGGVVQDAGLTLGLLALLAIVADTPLFTVGRRGLPAAVSGSVLLVFTIMLEWGRGSALYTQVLALLIGGLLARRRPWQIVFDIGRYGLALFMAARMLSVGARPYLLGPTDVLPLLIVLAAIATWFVVFHVLTATEAWLRSGEPWLSVSRRHLLPEALTALPLLLLSPLLVWIINVNPWLVIFVLPPMYTVSRMTSLRYQRARESRTDALTGLPNRGELFRLAGARLSRARRPAGRVAPDGPAPEAAQGAGSACALMMLDIDRFRYINEALGHEVGDRVLVEVSRRLDAMLAREVGDGVIVARLGGDEFGVFTPDIGDRAAAVRLGDAISAELDTPVLVDDLPLEVASSLGIAMYPEHGRDFPTLLRHADSAMYRAKQGNEQVAMYGPGADSTSTQRLRLVSDLRHALQEPGNTEIEVCYQPQVALDSGALVGVEALLRWRHPREGAVPPEEVIRAAEHTGVMGLLTEHVIDEVLAALARWGAQDLYLRASINVSVRDLYGSGLVGWLGDRMRRYDISPGQVQLEITESALMADPDRVLANLNRLHEMGIAVALDDFGTGYSSMLHLRRLPVSEVKIDRSFVRSMADNPDDDAIVRSIIGLSRELGMRVVAEGVEDLRTARMLDAHGCHIGQGWYYARAMPAHELIGWLGRYRSPNRVLEAVPDPVAGTVTAR